MKRNIQKTASPEPLAKSPRLTFGNQNRIPDNELFSIPMGFSINS